MCTDEPNTRLHGNLMIKIVLLRHGESIWNKENLFTGWTDVDLSEQGKAEARRAGELLEGRGVHVRRRVHVGPEAGDPHALDRAGRAGPDVDPRGALVAAQRAALRGAPGPEQGADRGEVRRRAGLDLAAELRRPAAGPRGVRPALSRHGPALPGAEPAPSCPGPNASRTPSRGSSPTGTSPSCRRSGPARR